MKLETIVYEKKGAIAYVTLNRPEKLNAMNARLHGELAWAWADFRDDADLRVAILSGKGRCFSAGADLSGGVHGHYQYPGDFPDITRTQGLYKPIIAALHNHVVGYGMWIAMDADIRIATEDVRFWLPEPQWGIATIPRGLVPQVDPLGDRFRVAAPGRAGQCRARVSGWNGQPDCAGRPAHGRSRKGRQPNL